MEKATHQTLRRQANFERQRKKAPEGYLNCTSCGKIFEPQHARQKRCRPRCFPLKSTS